MLTTLLHRALAFLAAFVLAPVTPLAAQQAPESEVVFANVRLFDGTSDTLSAPTTVVVRGNLIAAIGPVPRLPRRKRQ
ncbi:MAG: hypothetical protein ACK4IC_09275 [Erythrobacter sp.]